MEGIELIEASGTFYGLGVDILSFYITVTSGYLIVAYLAGDKLTPSQLTIITTLYVVMALLASYGATSWIIRGAYFSLELAKSQPDVPTYTTYVVPIMMGFLLVGGIVACLKFMWDVRHPKSK